jgi:hypothetical protein
VEHRLWVRFMLGKQKDRTEEPGVGCGKWGHLPTEEFLKETWHPGQTVIWINKVQCSGQLCVPTMLDYTLHLFSHSPTQVPSWGFLANLNKSRMNSAPLFSTRDNLYPPTWIFLTILFRESNIFKYSRLCLLAHELISSFLLVEVTHLFIKQFSLSKFFLTI